jgi:sulfite exporter TauE/SafE
MVLQALLTGAFAGLASAPHCAAMCGPLCAATCARAVSGFSTALRYQLGRTLGYAFVGALAGGFGHAALQLVPSSLGPMVFGAAAALSLLTLAWRAWRGARASEAVVARLVPLRVSERRSLFVTLRQLVPQEPLVVGALTALLPCGALAAALVLAASTQQRAAGALVMLGFATTSASGVLAGGWLLQRLASMRGRVSSRALAVAFCALALLAGLRPFYRAAEASSSGAATGAYSHCH